MAAVMTEHDDGPICEKFELPQAWCSHCRGHDKVEQRIRRSRPADNDVRYRFFARYPGRCNECGEIFQPDDYIGVTVDDQYVCEGCA